MKVYDFWVKKMCSTSGLKVMAKSFVVLSACFFLTIQSTGSIAYSSEIPIQKMIYEVESSYGKPINKIECSKLPKHNVSCLSAKHAKKLRTNTVELSKLISSLFMVLSIFSGFFCVVSFIFTPYFKEGELATSA